MFLKTKRKSLFDKYEALPILQKHIKEFSSKLKKHNVFLVAAGIAFNLLLYALPLGLIAVFIVDKVFGVTKIAPFLLKATEDFLPATPEVEKYLNYIINELSVISSHSSVTGIIGIVVLLWFSSLLISALRNSLNTVLELEPKYFFLIYRIKDMGLTIVLTIAIFIMLLFMPFVALVEKFLSQNLPEFLQEVLSMSIISLTSIVVSFLVFLIIYSWVPNQTLPRYLRFWSSLVSAAALEIGKQFFGWYISGFSNYGRFYGSFAIIASMVIWLYYFSLIVLLSAEIVKFIHDIKYPNVIAEINKNHQSRTEHLKKRIMKKHIQKKRKKHK